MAHYDHFKRCHHGKDYDEPCYECELVLLREREKNAKAELELCQTRIALIEAQHH